MMQTQDPDIQTKLLAMQKQMSAQKSAEVTSLQNKDKQLQLQFQQQQSLKQQQIQQAQALETARAKKKALTQEQKDEQTRYVCSYNDTCILDSILVLFSCDN